MCDNIDNNKNLYSFCRQIKNVYIFVKQSAAEEIFKSFHTQRFNEHNLYNIIEISLILNIYMAYIYIRMFVISQVDYAEVSVHHVV